MNRGILRILLFGKDARTDAAASAFQASATPTEIFAYSDFAIPGLLRKCVKVRVKPLTDRRQMLKFAREVKPDLALIGPEEPLEMGLVDDLESIGIPCFGPRKELAKIETSKAWARILMDRHQIPGNPRHRVFEGGAGIDEYLHELADYVIKPDGLTGGKGVKVFGDHLKSHAEAGSYALEVLEAHGRVVIEERLDGEEFSLQTITDGVSFVHCPVVQDHKRAEPGDTGPNTGGMGSYSFADFSLPFLEPPDVARARQINEAVIRALRTETGVSYRGVLYGGFMATADGLKLIEFNARFGDPEALNVLPLLETDFVEVCRAVTREALSEIKVEFKHKATVCKYVVPESYPDGKGKGDPIRVPDEFLNRPNLHCYWAATEKRNSEVTMTGSRAVAFVGVGDTLDEAERLAEEGAGSVEGPVRYRSDIGRTTAIEARVRHMQSLRAKAAAAH